MSPKKRPHVLNAHNFLKNGTMNKSRVSLRILRKFSKFFNFDFRGLRKGGLKLVTTKLTSPQGWIHSDEVRLGLGWVRLGQVTACKICAVT